MNHQDNVMQALNCSVSGQNIVGSQATTMTTTSGTNMLYVSPTDTSATNVVYYYDTTPGTLWGFWQNQYYPNVIRESYPIYIQEKAMDKGKQAFEILKALMDKGLVKVDKVKDFIEAMDTLLKAL